VSWFCAVRVVVCIVCFSSCIVSLFTAYFRRTFAFTYKEVAQHASIAWVVSIYLIPISFPTGTLDHDFGPYDSSSIHQNDLISYRQIIRKLVWR